MSKHIDDKTTVVLNNGIEMPLLGLGVYKSGDDTYDAVRFALDVGYRSIDTAALYGNEKAVGDAVRASGVNRNEVFITTKVWNDDLRAHTVRKACENSLKLLNLDYIDLYLIHWPVADEYITAYSVMEELFHEQKIRTLGVSNFLPKHIETLLPKCEIVPAVDQLEIHPYLSNTTVIDFCHKLNIMPEAWAPLARGAVSRDLVISTIAEKHSKTPSQVALRWHLQRGEIVIPKSVHASRILENSKVFDFCLDGSDMALINALDNNGRTGPDPDNFSL
ncbi:MAG: aldo/keto reductase [Christensenellaceae bacterium]|jgi:diketogulonate reductase-like aldo/keto reductase|nr:aldo/keto reductase [Christensenellaceae bacterium]